MQTLRRSGNRRDAADAALADLWRALVAGDRARFDDQVAWLDREAREGGAAAAWRAAVARGARDHLVGRLDDAELWARRALSIGRFVRREPDLRGLAFQTFLLQLLSIRHDQGRLAEIEPPLAIRSETMPVGPTWQIAGCWT